MRDYEIEISDEERSLAVKAFIADLADPNGRPMTLPTIALSSSEIDWDQKGHVDGEFTLVIDIQEISGAGSRR